MAKDFDEPVCLLCVMGIKLWKLRRQYIHHVKTKDENTGVSRRKIVVCPIMNARPRVDHMQEAPL